MGLVFAIAFSIGLAGCATRVGSSGLSASAPRAASATRDFQANLRDVTLTCRRAFGQSGDSYGRAPAGTSLQVTMTLKDGVGGRLFRLREPSGLRSVVDMSGRELVEKGEGVLKNSSSSGLADFPAITEQRSREAMTLQTMLALDRIPDSLRRIAGEITLELVTDDIDRVMPLPPVGEPTEVASGITATVKLLDAEKEAAPGSPWAGLASVEVRSPTPEAGASGPIVQSVEVLDANGGVLATLARREESTVGAMVRRRFSNEGGYASSRMEAKSEKARRPHSLRFRAITGIEQVVVPFDFGPVEWVSRPAQ